MTAKKLLLGFRQTAQETASAFSEDKCSLIAAALAFYSFLSLIPLMLVFTAGLGLVVGSSEAIWEASFGYLQKMIPEAGEIGRFLESMTSQSPVAGGIGLLGLIWGGSGAFSTLQSALHTVWHHKKHRTFFIARLVAVLIMILVIVLLLLSILATWGLEGTKRYRLPLGNCTLGDLPLIWGAIGILGPFLLTVTMFLCLYQAVPHPGIRLWHLLGASAIAALCWELAKYGFTWYISHLPGINQIYGSLGTVVILLLWIYCSAIIFLFGAELAWVWAQKEKRTAQTS